MDEKKINKKIPLRSIHYQWETLLYRNNFEKKDYQQEFGYKVLSRNNVGKAEKIEFMIYSNNEDDLYLIGQFNNWGEDTKNLKNYFFKKKSAGFQKLIVTGIKHKDSYLIMKIKDNQKEFLRDPASTYFDDEGNSIFWDFEDPTTYKMKEALPELIHRPTIILQTDPLGLVAKWYEYKPSKKTISESKQNLFDYIRTSGVIKKIKELGFNTIQFLPLAQSIDGDNWKYRYLVAYPFAIQKNWGSPDDFKKLIDEFHKEGIAVINDLVLSHAPFKDFKLFSLQGEDVGLHKWNDKTNKETYLEEYTPWGTMRFKYGDEHVRKYLTESAQHFIKNYSIDGFRIDNVDGILRYGDSGQGEERPHGRLFLRNLIKSLYEQKPDLIINLESHYFYEDNAKMLVAPINSDARALGATAYNSSRLTYFFHKEFMPKSIDDISIWTIKQITEEKEWGRSNSTIADFHNHDAAAGLMEGRATGSYAYDALILKKPELHFHAVGKIKVMEAIISFGTEGRILDLLQTFLLQKGTFEHDSSILWILLNDEESKKLIAYKKYLNSLLHHPAFWPENTINRKFVNVDEKNKVLVIKREDKTQGTDELFYCLINTSNKTVREYAIGIEEKNSFQVIMDSELSHDTPKSVESVKSNNFELLPFEIKIKNLKPYQIIVFKGKTKNIY